MRTFTLLAICVGLFALGAPVDAAAQGPAVVQVLGLDVNDNLPGFLEQFKKYQAIVARLELRSEARVYQATLAGADAGAVYIVLEHPNLVTMAQDGDKLQADAAWQALLAENQQLGIGLVSNSVSADITP